MSKLDEARKRAEEKLAEMPVEETTEEEAPEETPVETPAETPEEMPAETVEEPVETPAPAETEGEYDYESSIADEPEETTEETTEEAPVEEAPETPEETTEENPAEEAPADEQIQRFAQEIVDLRAQVEDLSAQLAEANKLNESLSRTNEDEAAAPLKPEFDFDAFRLMGDDDAQNYLKDFDAKNASYYGSEADKRYKPLLDEHERNARKDARRNAIAELAQSGELPGIEDYEEKIFENLNDIPSLRGNDTPSAIAAAYLIALGSEAINDKLSTKEQKSPADIAAEIEKNPEVMRIIEQHKAESLRDNENVPTFPRRATARSIPAEKPLSLDDARKRAEKRFN